MLIVVSPAKTLDYDSPLPSLRATQPRLLEHSAELVERARKLSPADLASLMKVSDKIAHLNVERFAQWSRPFDKHNARPALFAFKGDVYTGLDVSRFDGDDLKAAQSRLRILSGLYGVLRPLDWMQPYRLEMGTRLATPAGANLYQFWGDRLAEHLNQRLADDPAPVLLNLASQEYFKAVDRKALRPRVVECVFEDWKGGSWKIISFHAKRARGLMARHAIQQRARKPEDLRGFDAEGWAHDAAASSTDRMVFRRRLK